MSVPQTIAPDVLVSRTEAPEQDTRLVLKESAKIPPEKVEVEVTVEERAPPVIDKPSVVWSPPVPALSPRDRVEVAEPVTLRMPRKRARPEVSRTPSAVVAFPIPTPPITKRSAWS